MWNWFQTVLWISPMHFSSLTHLQILMMKEKQIEEKKEKIQNGCWTGFKQTFGSPISPVHFPPLTYLQILVQRKRNYRIEKKTKNKKWSWFQRDLWISHLADALLSTHPSSNSYVPLDRGVSISASIKKNLIFVRNNNKTSKYFLFLRVCIFSYLGIFYVD